MRLTAQEEYGLRCLLQVARGEDKAMTTPEIAEREGLSEAHVHKLMRLLQNIERSPGVVRVRRLHLRKSSDNKETLDVTMTVSAWQGA